MTVKYVFDVHPEDKFACMADVGWITGMVVGLQRDRLSLPFSSLIPVAAWYGFSCHWRTSR